LTDPHETRPDVIGRDHMQDVSFDPFGLMPAELTARPRVFVTEEHLARSRRLVREQKWAQVALERLLSAAGDLKELPGALPVPPDLELNAKVLQHAQHNALAHALMGEERHRESALAALRLIAEAYPRWPINETLGRGSFYSLGETRFTSAISQTYDLLAATGLAEQDETLFRNMLLATRETIDAQPHFACGNHNTWGIFACLAVGVALGDAQRVHDALYGFESKGQWRYGIVHQLRHDILSDGLQWERAPGYHFYTLMGHTEIAWLLANVGVDLWHAELPVQETDDGWDVHRAYGPPGRTKCLKAAYDAPFYAMFGNGDFSMLHDSGLANIRGAWIWGIIYELAYQAYGDPKYAWLLNRTEREYEEHEHPDLPMALHASRGVVDFVRLDRVSLPEGHFNLAEDCDDFSLTGRHTGGCTLFPTTGQAVLRSDAADETAPAAFMFWGPHSAGHQSPAALHVDLSAAGHRITDSPRSLGYEDPMHLTWHCATIAHNTVTVDGRPMFPFEPDDESIWWTDRERGGESDGVLLLLKPDGPVKAARACNERVYPGVRLDRTVIVTTEFVVDVFRVLSEDAHQYDWTMHGVGSVAIPPDAEAVDLGEQRGYAHFTDAFRLGTVGACGVVRWEWGTGATVAQFGGPAGAEIIVASDPDGSQCRALGELAPYAPRTTALVRASGQKLVFASLWQWPQGGRETELLSVRGQADGEVALEIEGPNGKNTLRLPWEPATVELA